MQDPHQPFRAMAAANSLLLATYAAAGNRFLLARRGIIFDPATIRSLCKKHSCDGILSWQSCSNGTFSLRIFNGDGTEAETSGNGTRILGKFLLDSGKISGPTCTIHTPCGDVRCAFECDGTVSTVLGPWHMNPLAVEFQLSCGKVSGYEVSIGNPHFVIPVDCFPEFWRQMAAEISTHERFPNGTNVEFVKKICPGTLAMVVWERGVGETLSCGSGAACAVAVYGKVFNFGDEVAVAMEGGTIFVRAVGNCMRIGGKVECCAMALAE